MAIAIGTKPPDLPPETKDQAKIQEHQDQMAEYWQRVQAAQHEMDQEIAARSALEKGSHDAMMAIIQNLK
jgi:division protein CdvB (Snf7/Vps24/ESCRT-III family)